MDKKNSKKQINQNKALLNKNNSKINKPNLKKIETSIKQKINENIKYNYENLHQKKLNKNQINNQDQKKCKEEPKNINVNISKDNSNDEKLTCEIKKPEENSKLNMIKIKKNEQPKKLDNIITQEKNFPVTEKYSNSKSYQIINKYKKKTSVYSMPINSEKKYHSFADIKESMRTNMPVLNSNSIFNISDIKTESISFKNSSQESKSDKNPSVNSETYFKKIRNENLLLIKTFMAKMREENDYFIKSLAKEMTTNLSASLTLTLKEANTDLVNKIFEKMDNKGKDKSIINQDKTDKLNKK